jgi:hypothetical protein
MQPRLFLPTINSGQPILSQDKNDLPVKIPQSDLDHPLLMDFL